MRAQKSMARELGWLIAGALLSVGLWAGCGAAVQRVQPGPAVPGVSLSGKWYSTQFGDMQLVQQGQKVTGSYKHPRGPAHDGRIRGQLDGDLLRVEWIQPGDSSAGVFPIRGHAWFRVKKQGDRLFMGGKWGYDDAEEGGGSWVAEKSGYQ